MDQLHYKEMVENLDRLRGEYELRGKQIVLFGHCNATETLADWFLDHGLPVAAILDNNRAKQGRHYRGIGIVPPQRLLEMPPGESLVCVAARAYAAMEEQLRGLGYEGPVRKLVEYNGYAEYSLSQDTLVRRRQKVERGLLLLRRMEQKYPGYFKLLCPFPALGDVCFTMYYLPYFMEKRSLKKCAVCVIGEACAQTVRLFGPYPVETLSQKDMEELAQAAVFTGDENVFLSHQDRPYVINLSKALYRKKIPLEKLYCCGVFGLPASLKPYRPSALRPYKGLEEIAPGKSVILSPYAKSVTALKPEIWKQLVDVCRDQGYACYTNTAGDEEPLPGTHAISPAVSELQSVVERAGTFIGIRSGICDVLRWASCRKIALYPDYHYCGTRWKAVDIYELPEWENIVVKEGFPWNKS